MKLNFKKPPVTVFVCLLLVLIVPIYAAGTVDVSRLPASPHDRFNCFCHPPATDLETGETGVDGSKFMAVDQNMTLLCGRCHKKRCFHVTDRFILKEQKTFTLRKEGSLKDSMTCTTCHQIHDGMYPALLKRPKQQREQVRGIWYYCDECHEEGAFRIHGKSYESYTHICEVCHPRGPPVEIDGQSHLTPQYYRICLLCHPDVPVSCINAVRPGLVSILENQIGQITLSNREGQLTCGSCHLVMSEPDGSSLLRSEYANFRELISKKNIHRTGLLCDPCHGREIRRGELNPNLVMQDPEELCRLCHNNKIARRDIHPSGMVPRKVEGISIHDDFPLYEGRMVCITCHDSCHHWESANRSFVRGGPFDSREDACFQCHDMKGYAQINPHEQINENGEVDESICLYCHTSVPDRNIKGVDAVGFFTDLKAYCVGCHAAEYPHPAGANHSHIVPTESIRDRMIEFQADRNVNFPLGPGGEQLCFTCHDPHENGVIGEAGAVEEFFHKIRQGEGYVVCNACHGGGGLK